MKLTKTLWLAALALFAASCSSDDMVDAPIDSSVISFKGVAVKNASRADFTTETLSEFSVWATANDGTTTTNVFDGTTVSKSGEAWTYAGDVKYWTAGSNYEFFAIAPTSAGTFTLANKTLSFTNDGTKDLIFAYNTVTAQGINNSAVNFSFNHMLSRVRVQVSNEVSSTITITSIVVKDAPKTAVLTCGANPTWAEATETGDFTLVNSKTINANTSEYSDIYYFLPVNSEKEYSLEVTVEGENTARTGTFKVQNLAGNSYNLPVSISADEIEIGTITVGEFPDFVDPNVTQSQAIPTYLSATQYTDIVKTEGTIENSASGYVTTIDGLSINQTQISTAKAMSSRSEDTKGLIYWFKDETISLESTDCLVLDLASASNGPVEIGIRNGEDIAYTTLTTGETSIALPLENLKYTEGTNVNTEVNLSGAHIILRTAASQEQTIKIQNFYVSKKVTVIEKSSTTSIDAGSDDYDFLALEPSVMWNPGSVRYLSWQNNTLSFLGTNGPNVALAWFNTGSTTDLSGYEKLVLELSEASDHNVEVAFYNGAYFGGTSTNSVLTAGEKTLEITLTDLTLDMSEISFMVLRSSMCNAQTIKVKNFYLKKADSGNTDPATPTEETFDLLQQESYWSWPINGTSSNQDFVLTWEDNILTFDSGKSDDDNDGTYTQSFGNAARGWTLTDPLSNYESLTLELSEAIDTYLQLAVGVDGMNDSMHVEKLNSTDTDPTKLTITLENLYYTQGEEENKAKQLDLTTAKYVMLKTNDWCEKQTIKVKSFYLTKKSSN